ncbi:MAG: glycerol-3-phosphate dehydrogenase/oxidase [Thermoanaerobaculia bacterium]
MKWKIAVVGGGINGAGIAWELARRGYEVDLFEKGEFGAATSSATTKMIHGGLRYLEQLQFGLVRESLRDRKFLLQNLPRLVHPLELYIPIFHDSRRPMWMIQTGLILYDLLAGRDRLENHRRLSADQILEAAPIRRARLIGGFRYLDAQVDDRELVRTVVASAVRDGLRAHEKSEVTGVERLESSWHLSTSGETDGDGTFDLLVNAAGPWMNGFLERNALPSHFRLSLIRGSHIVLRRRVSEKGFLLESPGEKRVFFVLPWKGRTLVGTTEELHRGPIDGVRATEVEIHYLLDRFNEYFAPMAKEDEIVESFAGVRPLTGRQDDPNDISREYRIETAPRLVNVFGGKMTTFLSLANSVGEEVDRLLGERRRAAPPVFAGSDGR